VWTVGIPYLRVIAVSSVAAVTRKGVQMNGRRAKALRKETQKLVGHMKPLDHEYNQVNNCLSWRHAVIDGKPQYDGDGVALLEPYKAPGTITHAQPFMVIYKMKKKQYYRLRAMCRGTI